MRLGFVVSGCGYEQCAHHGGRKGCQSFSGWPRRSSTASITAGLMPRSLCVPYTSMFSARVPVWSMQFCHDATPSVRVDRRGGHRQGGRRGLEGSVRAGEGDHLTDQFGSLTGQRPGVDPAEAPAHHADASAVCPPELLDAVAQSCDDASRRSDVAAEAPAVRPVALAAHRPPQRHRGPVVGAETGQDEDGVRIAAAEVGIGDHTA